MRDAALAIEARQLVRRFGEVTALDRVDLSVRAGEFFSLLGPSGCGKTTLLRLIGGLDHPDSGTLQICGAEALSIPAHRRPVNTVFQSYALFPHMNVRDNIGFGLRMRRLPKAEIARRVERVMELVQVAPLQNRRPVQLSGGEKQRVALARAIVNEPQILLLDEPLGALDLKLRRQLQLELHQLQRRLGITFVYVTHDQDEALTLSDRLAVLQAGRLEQAGTVEEVYEQPRNRFVAEFLGGCNLVEATCVGTDGDGAFVDSPFGRLHLCRQLARGKLTLAIRPEKIRLEGTPDSGHPLRAVVRDSIYNGSETHYGLELNGRMLRATILNSEAGSGRYSVGSWVGVCFPAQALVVLAD